MAAAQAYPVRVDAALDSPLSRGLWLVKWILVIPHYFVLAFLWLAFVVLSAVAMVAIVVTGRYPRAIFEFNGACCGGPGGCSTTRSARSAPTGTRRSRWPRTPLIPRTWRWIPAAAVRGLALVKWWLLAIPQYIIISLLTGGVPGGIGSSAATTSTPTPTSASGLSTAVSGSSASWPWSPR